MNAQDMYCDGDCSKCGNPCSEYIRQENPELEEPYDIQF
jgi:hypothetical protein